MEVALEAGADDVQVEEETIDVYAAPEDWSAVRQALEDAGLPIASSQLVMVPSTTVRLEGKQAEQMLKLMDALEDHDDVQNVHANFDLDESLLAAMA